MSPLRCSTKSSEDRHISGRCVIADTLVWYIYLFQVCFIFPLSTVICDTLSKVVKEISLTTACHQFGQTLTIDHMLTECTVLQECRDEYYSADVLSPTIARWWCFHPMCLLVCGSVCVCNDVCLDDLAMKNWCLTIICRNAGGDA